ncbi:MAG: SHOCT domain-containing protein [Actinobacteria bacterium]|nr:SHOCT domain-containing protein [Actinomycetota bacterium]
MGMIGLLLMAAFWIAIIVGVVLLIKALIRRDERSDARARHDAVAGTPHAPGYPLPPSASAGSNSDALRILEERYARGDIDREDFLTRKADLTA